MFKRRTGKPNMEFYAKAASTAFSNGALVYADGSGGIIPADSTSGNHIGVVMKDVAATDADYASTTKIPVDVPLNGDEFEVDTTGATAAIVGTYVDLTDSLTANVGASSKSVLLVTQVLSATKIVVKINAMAANKDVSTT